MSAPLIEINLREGGAREALKRVEGRLGDMAPVYRNIAGVLMDVTEENFRLGGRPTWTPLAPATIRARSKNGTWPGELLKQSGVLFASVHSDATSDSASISAATPYAEIQHKGGTIERGARAGTIRLRTNARGELIRQGASGRRRNLAVFAKDAHKRARSVEFEAQAHSITIPARPYLPVTVEGELQPEAEDGIFAALNAYLQAGWEG